MPSTCMHVLPQCSQALHIELQTDMTTDHGLYIARKLGFHRGLSRKKMLMSHRLFLDVFLETTFLLGGIFQ